MSKVIAIANFKGGCGKTTTAIDLSAALVKLGKKVLAVDSDSQGHLTIGFGFPKNQRITLKDMMENEIMGFDYDPMEENNRPSTTWENCALRQELNGAFLTNCYSEDERARILETTFSEKGMESIQDKVFLLGEKDVIDFFKEQKQGYNVCLASKTAKQQLKADHQLAQKWVLFWRRDMDFEDRKRYAMGVRPAMWVKI